MILDNMIDGINSVTLEIVQRHINPICACIDCSKDVHIYFSTFANFNILIVKLLF